MSLQSCRPNFRLLHYSGTCCCMLTSIVLLRMLRERTWEENTWFAGGHKRES
ncbi:hypothetical protein DL95DRAFT_492776 [Leptodontidium sp. 2 PMI_412]|nr:hypothetical protein DL95DRAFT_492776 [Leptodontidium sp. 2 PMI_412]